MHKSIWTRLSNISAIRYENGLNKFDRKLVNKILKKKKNPNKKKTN